MIGTREKVDMLHEGGVFTDGRQISVITPLDTFIQQQQRQYQEHNEKSHSSDAQEQDTFGQQDVEDSFAANQQEKNRQIHDRSVNFIKQDVNSVIKTEHSLDETYSDSSGSTGSAVSATSSTNSSLNGQQTTKSGFDPSTHTFNPDELKPTPIQRKSQKQLVRAEDKDDKYWDKRRKNNLAAKRSREARRSRENQISLRASYLEKDNALLKEELLTVKEELQILR
jgi:hypothetical protein